MQRPTNLKAGDKFRVIVGYMSFNLGEIVSLQVDDGTDAPFFCKEDKFHYSWINFSKLEPYTKTIRDAQVGDVVVDEGGEEYMVLERWQNTVKFSQRNNFKKTGHDATFDELEEYFTLKDAPEVVDDKTAEAMKLLKEAGYKISKE